MRTPKGIISLNASPTFQLLVITFLFNFEVRVLLRHSFVGRRSLVESRRLDIYSISSDDSLECLVL